MASLTRAEKRERQRVYNVRSTERKARRRMLQDRAVALLGEPATDEAPEVRILRHLASTGDSGALRVWAIVSDTIEECGGLVDLRAAEMIAAAHDY